MKKRNIIWLLLLMMGCTFSIAAIAKNFVANTPVKQSDYEPLHQGWVNINATLFNAPCNLNINVKGRVMLTGCGAGSVFSAIKAFNVAANTPATLQFYDVQKGYVLPHYPINLLNGDNPINLPLSTESNKTFRLEVNYE